MPLTKGQMACAKCGAVVEVEMDQPQIMNLEQCSVVVIAHSGQVACRCGTTMVPALAQVRQLAFGLVVVQPEQQKLIVPPGKNGFM